MNDDVDWSRTMKQKEWAARVGDMRCKCGLMYTRAVWLWSVMTLQGVEPMLVVTGEAYSLETAKALAESAAEIFGESSKLLMAGYKRIHDETMPKPKAQYRDSEWYDSRGKDWDG